MNIVSMKIIMIIIVICFSSWFGFFVSARYKKREMLLSDILLFCNYLIGDFSFLKSRLSDNISHFRSLSGKEFNDMLEGYFNLLKEKENISISILGDFVKNRYLKIDEYSRFLQFLYSLGTSDSDSQIKNISSFRATFEPCHIQAIDDRKKYGGMYSKLGVIIGIGLGILII